MIFRVLGFAMSKDQINLPFSFSNSKLFTVPPGTWLNALFVACSPVTLACFFNAD